MFATSFDRKLDIYWRKKCDEENYLYLISADAGSAFASEVCKKVWVWLMLRFPEMYVIKKGEFKASLIDQNSNNAF